MLVIIMLEIFPQMVMFHIMQYTRNIYLKQILWSYGSQIWWGEIHS